ncbi:hypothetical protein IMSAG049_01281 [Clostridiales bacterium]|nr:hypothetical protein IMSAG049_01281 [Clostridiales bacterium]
MALQLDIGGITLQLDISDYEPTDKDCWDSQWCKCDFSFYSEGWLNYNKKSDEVLLSCEVEDLDLALTQLLCDKLCKPMEISCIEPDFEFILYPKHDLRSDPRYTYIQPGAEIADIFVEWRIHFWHDGLTANYLTITLRRQEIAAFRDYLSFIIGKT